MKRDLFLILLLIVVTGYIVFPKNGFLLSSSSRKNISSILEKDGEFISALQKGDTDSLNRVFHHLNSLSIPAVLFNLTMRPVVWNNLALNYHGDYNIVKTVKVFDNPVGYVGLGEAGIKNLNKKNRLKLYVLALIIFLIVSFIKNRYVNIGFLLLLICFTLFFKSAFFPLLFFSLLYLKYGRDRIKNEVASLIFFLFAITGCYQLFLTPYVFFDLLSFFRNVDFFEAFFVSIVASTFFLTLRPSILSFSGVILSAFLGKEVFLFSCTLFVLSLVRGNKISVFLLKLLLFAIMLSLTGHYFSRSRLRAFLRRADFSYNRLRQKGEKRLRYYLELAKTRGYANLRDFIARSGLEKEDFYAAYFNIIGEVVDEYSNNMIEMMEIPRKIRFSTVEVGGKKRLVVSGSTRFKVGILSLTLACDVYSLSILKNYRFLRDYMEVKKGEKGYIVNLKEINLFNLITDISLIFVLSIIFFLSFFSLNRRKGLFERMIFAIYVGFATILVFLGLILFIHSSRIARGVMEKGIKDNLLKVKGFIENDPSSLSVDYLLWLKSVFNVEIGVYGNGVLQLSSGGIGLSLLIPFDIYQSLLKDKLKNKKMVYFSGDSAFGNLTVDTIPFAMLCAKGENDFRPLFDFLRIVSFVFLIVFIVSYFVAYEITRSLVTPLLKLSDGAKSIVNGNFGISIDYDKDDEIGVLIRSIEYMANSLQENYNRLKTIIDNVPTGIALIDKGGKIIMTNRVFDELNEKLKSDVLSSRGRDEIAFEDKRFFVSKREVEKGIDMVVVEDLTNVVKASKLEVITDMARKVAHDIKNPLTPIKLNIEYLTTIMKKGGKNLEEVLPEIANNILSKVEELKRISAQFSGIFKASKDETYEEIELIRFLEDIFASYPGINYRIEGDKVFVNASKLKLARVFENLIENSIEFSDNPFIEIDIKDKGDFVFVSYRDNGMGIDGKHIKKVFEPYFSTREDGTGLGLFIVKEFLQDMGGDIVLHPSKKGVFFELKFRKNRIEKDN